MELDEEEGPDFVRINMEEESLPENVGILAEEVMRLTHAI